MLFKLAAKLRGSDANRHARAFENAPRESAVLASVWRPSNFHVVFVLLVSCAIVRVLYCTLPHVGTLCALDGAELCYVLTIRLSLRDAEVDDAATIRVTNLSEETRDQDLKELFSPHPIATLKPVSAFTPYQF